jgi:hypothetical protein
MLWVNRRGLKLSLRHWRSDPFVTFILLFSLETSAALSSAFSNFGLLARERIMFTPLLILLIPAYRHTKAAGTPSVAQPALKQKLLIRSAAQAAMSDR